jgi:NAD(P)-dependent dehydrogenase (short-subunit alcohol dehydrogenase family)
MNLQLTDSVAVIVGGASGIGLAIGKAFADEGAAVVLADRSAAVAERAGELAQSTRTRTAGRMVDVVDYEGMRRLADSVVSEFGRADHIVYAAGMGSGKFGFPFWNLSPSDWPRILEVNLVGAVNTAHAFAPHLTAARRGTVLMISSVAAQIGSQTDPPYSAAKAALLNFTHCAAKDFAAYDVRVNAICPGMVQTPLNRGVWQAWHDSQPPETRRSYEDWAGEKVRKIAPLGRWQTPEDIAAMAVFLASPRANNITGQTLNVDGGQVMHC